MSDEVSLPSPAGRPDACARQHALPYLIDIDKLHKDITFFLQSIVQMNPALVYITNHARKSTASRQRDPGSLLIKLQDQVNSLIKELSAELVMPKFQSILQSEIKEKSPGDIVTVVDHAVEHALNTRLPDLLPGSRVIGEEAVAATPDLIQSLNDGVVWLVDPLDGTRNFVNGSSDFAIMIALLRDGVTINSWIYSPVHNTMAFAEKGNGANWNGERVRSASFEKSAMLKGYVHTRFLPATWPETIRQRAEGVAELIPPCGSAGATYPQLLEEKINFIIYWRTLAWDHVPGALIVEETGGIVTRFDGSPYIASDKAHGLLVAANQEIAERLRALLPM